MIGKTEPRTVRLQRKNASAEVTAKLDLRNPHLRSTEDPYLYTLATFISDAKTGELLDTYLQTTGFRYFSFDPKTGFSLNGKL